MFAFHFGGVCYLLVCSLCLLSGFIAYCGFRFGGVFGCMFDLDCIVGFTLMFTFILMLLEYFSLLCYYFATYSVWG